MNPYFRNLVSNIISALILTGLGVVLMVWPSTALENAAPIFGIALVFGGIFSIIMFFLLKDWGAGMFIRALAFLLFGAMILIKPSLFSYSFPILMGLFLLIRGLGDIGHVFTIHRREKQKWKTALIFSLVILCFGCLVFFHPAFVEPQIIIFTAIGMIVCGLADLFLFRNTRIK